jgi:hypothetical protein
MCVRCERPEPICAAAFWRERRGCRFEPDESGLQRAIIGRKGGYVALSGLPLSGQINAARPPGRQAPEARQNVFSKEQHPPGKTFENRGPALH